MAKIKLTYAQLMELAKEYAVDQNAMFLSAIDRYVKQVETVQRMQETIDREGMMVMHKNIKGDSNMDVNPLVVQLPKYIDTANKTMTLMLDIIDRLGRKIEEKPKRFGDIEL